MKREFFVLTIIISFFYSCDKTKDLSIDNGIKLEPFIVTNYQDDAIQLYIRALYSDTDTLNDSDTEIDSLRIIEILGYIEAVYKTNSTITDTIFNKYKIHSQFCYNYNSLMIKADSNASEIKNLVKGIRPTGNYTLDNLLTSYQFDSVKLNMNSQKFKFLTLYSGKKFNILPLESKFKEIQSIVTIELGHGCLKNYRVRDIILQNDGEYTYLTFIKGFGDCPAGCFYFVNWEYKVRDNKAEFIRRYIN
jgi:acyl carrier protein